MKIDVYLAFGSNLGDRVSAIQTGIEFLEKSNVELVTLSSFYTSRSKYLSDQPEFVNCVGHFTTKINPRELLDSCMDAEKAAGRQKREQYGPRELDVDLLLFGQQSVSEVDLEIPHHGIPDRLFVLVPLAEVSNELIVPGMGPVNELLEKARTTLPEEEEPTILDVTGKASHMY